MPDPRSGLGSQSLITLAAVVVIIAGLSQADTLVPPFLLAVLLSVLVAPVVLWLERRRVPAGIAVAVAMILVLAALGAFGALMTTALDGYREAVPGYREAMTSRMLGAIAWFQGHGINITSEQMSEVLQPGTVMEVSLNFLGGIVGALSYTALVVLTTMFILLEVAGFPRKLRTAMGDPNADLSQWGELLSEIQRYLVIKTIVSLITGVLATLLLTALGVDFPLLWGMVAFLLNYIPTVGSIIAAVPAVLIALIQPELGPGYALLVAAGYIAINTVLGNIIEPQLLGRRLGLSPLVVFLSLVFWVWVWGPLGGLLSVPLTIMVRLVLERSQELHFLSVLLGSSPDLEKPPPKRKILAKVRLPKDVPPESILRTDALDRVRIVEGDPSASVAAGMAPDDGDDSDDDPAPNGPQ